MRHIQSISIFCSVFLSVPGWAWELPRERTWMTNCSNMLLTTIPKDLTSTTTTLDLSHNLLAHLQSSDFRSISQLQVLIICHNKIQQLDVRVFEFNKKLRYLDLSHNQLKIVTWYPLTSLRHLDLSFNDFDTLPVSAELGNMLHLEVLGLSGAKIQKSDFQKIAHLPLHTILLGLRALSSYEEGSLPILNITKLHIILPRNTNFWVLLRDGIKTSKILEITNIGGESQFASSEAQQNLHLETSRTSLLLLNQLDLLWEHLFLLFQFVWHTSVEYIEIQNVTFGGNVDRDHSSFDYSNSMMRSVKLEHVNFRVFSVPPGEVYLLFTKMDLENLTISDALMPHILFPTYPMRFQYLNFASNALTDDLFQKPVQLSHLKTLILKNNKLETFSLVSCFISNSSLEYLDLSHNLLQHENDENCLWPETLTTMNLSSNKFVDSVFRCVPRNIQILDLSNNKIQAVPKEMDHLKSLRELNLALNFLTDLPGCGHFNRLSLLNVEMNSILSPTLGFFLSCQEVKTLKAGRNPFHCTCELRDFIQQGRSPGSVMAGWSDSYNCEYPLKLKGIPLKDAPLPELFCNTALLIVTITVILLVVGIAVAFCFLHFDLPWYLRMFYQWIQMRREVRRTRQRWKRKAQLHVFVSYSEHDSAWVRHELIPNLEKEHGSILICLQEGNFDPDQRIPEHIINCIEKRYKFIFVLSAGFLHSVWSHYEFCFAHHNLLHESSGVILILLEPIPLYCIPTKYIMLKSLLEKKAFLEWPRDRHKCVLFWANLRAAINVNLLETREMYELQTFTELNEESQGSLISLIATD